MGLLGDDDDRDERNERRDQKEYALLIEIRNTLHQFKRVLNAILSALLYPRGIVIKQLSADTGCTGEFTMAIKGIVAGATGSFGETPTPAGTVFPAGTTFKWSSDDPLTSLTPSADGTQVAVAVAANDAAASFNLTCASDFTPPSGGGPVSATVSVPVLPATANTPTGMSIDQTS